MQEKEPSTQNAIDSSPAYTSQTTWNSNRPHVMVVACSDGRLQANIDDFLHNHLSIDSYDRFYVPGGPGALAKSGHEFLRNDQCWRECIFLIEAHKLEELIFVFHSGASPAQDCATCADYARKLPTMTPVQIRHQQEEDAHELEQRLREVAPGVRVRVFRAEVMDNNFVQFVDLHEYQAVS